MVPSEIHSPGTKLAIYTFGHRAGKRVGRTGETMRVKPPSNAPTDTYFKISAYMRMQRTVENDTDHPPLHNALFENSWYQHMHSIGKATSNTSCYRNGTVKVGRNLNCITTIDNADMQGFTASLMDHFWLCGARLHLQLSPNWNGLCALVPLHTPSLVIPGVDITTLHDHPMSSPQTLLHHHVDKRATEYFGTTNWEEYRLFNDVQLFFGSIMLSIQVKARWLQITRWELMKAIIATEDGFNAIKEELHALMYVCMYHRYSLDLMTAMEGGVCKKIGTTCCTYVPSNDTDNGTVTEAFWTLHDLHKKMVDEGGAPDEWFEGWFDWVLSWISGLVKALTPLIVMLLLTCLISQVILACCRRMTASIGGTFLVRKNTTGVLEQSVIYKEIPFKNRRLGEEVVEESTREGNDVGEKQNTLYPNTHRTEAYNFHAEVQR
ncbi:uncharacterized protein LOC144769059 [Lissotriton helveticus]